MTIKVIRTIAGKVAIYAGPDLTLDAAGAHGPGWDHPGLTGVEIVTTIGQLPAGFVGGCFTYDEAGFVPIASKQAIIDARVAELKNIASSPTDWLIDLGPFFDRFGQALIPVLASSDPMVKALVLNVTVRKWIDLKRQDTADALNLIKGAGLIDAAKVQAILTTPVSPEENRALRTTYFA